MRRQILSKFDDTRLQAPAAFTEYVRIFHCPLERLEAVDPSRLHTEMRHDEIDVWIFLDQRNPFRRNAVGAVTCMQLNEYAKLPTFVECRAQPILGAIGPVCVHVGLQLNHAETVFLHVTLDGLDPVAHAATRIIDKAANETVRIFLNHFKRIRHIGINGLTPVEFPVRPCVDGVALWWLDKRLVDAARFAIDRIGAVHHLNQALAAERIAIMLPCQIDQIGRIATGIDDH